MDFSWIGNFVEKKKCVWLDDEGHFGGFFGGTFDDFALQENWKATQFGLEIVNLTDFHWVDKAFGVGGKNTSIHSSIITRGRDIMEL